MAQCSGYGGYREITVSTNVERGCFDGWPLSDPVLASSPPICGGSEVTFKPLVPRLSVREGFLALNLPGKIRHPYFTLTSSLLPHARSNRNIPSLSHHFSYAASLMPISILYRGMARSRGTDDAFLPRVSGQKQRCRRAPTGPPVLGVQTVASHWPALVPYIMSLLTSQRRELIGNTLTEFSVPDNRITDQYTDRWVDSVPVLSYVNALNITNLRIFQLKNEMTA
ncbi:hypothetical protein J6590_052182 [Homalodisca vitripennis]|nr:hypothetical protein J6590_052182 [Homalodisca vitripennis]